MKKQNIERITSLPSATFFLFGPRQSGKTTLLKQQFPNAFRIDLLKNNERIRYLANPSLLRDEVHALPDETPVFIDEIQKVPELLDEVHFLIEEQGTRFFLCGSSARKLRKTHANLLGGRALRRELFGFCARELGELFSLERILNHGPLPPHYLQDDPSEFLEAYVDIYLKEEVLDEGITRNLPVFSAFLRAAAIGDTEVVNFSNIARECSIASSTVRSYYEILEDTLIGAFLPAFTKRPKRRTTQSPKFYFRDVGVVNHLLHRQKILPKTEVFGKAYENWLFHELSVYLKTKRLNKDFSYWRLSTGVEVDFILGNAEVAIEAKGKDLITRTDAKNLHQFKKEYPSVEKCFIVCLEPTQRITPEGIIILPYLTFIDMLWNGDIIH